MEHCMKTFRLALIVCLALLLQGHPATAWEVQRDWTDPITGQPAVAAVTRNADNFRVSIYRDTDGRVAVVYSLPEQSFDRLPRVGRVVSVRPGDHRSVDMEATLAPTGTGRHIRSDGRNLRGVLWHGEGPSPTRGTLRNILDSTTLHARFYTDSGDRLDTSWSLEGAVPALTEALGIEKEADPELVARDQQRAQLFSSAARRCGANLRCIQGLPDCLDLLIEPAFDVPGFNACMARIAP